MRERHGKKPIESPPGLLGRHDGAQEP
jgi:hypothetical protein